MLEYTSPAACFYKEEGHEVSLPKIWVSWRRNYLISGPKKTLIPTATHSNR